MSNNLGRKLSPRRRKILTSGISPGQPQNKELSSILGRMQHGVLEQQKAQEQLVTSNKPSTILSKTQQQIIEVTKRSAFYQFHGGNTQYDRRSLFIFNGHNKLRRLIVWIIEWKIFENFILLVILLNSIALAAYDYNDRSSLKLRNQIIDKTGNVFTVIFTLECVLKIIGMGFVVHKKAYLRDGWNLLDFGVVIAGLLELIPGMRKLVNALIQALPDFGNVAVFLLFIFMLFAILGCHQYNGVLYNACRINKYPESPHSWAIDPNQTRVCSQDNVGKYQCIEGTYCGNPSQYGLKPSDDNVINNLQINYGITTFDNIGTSLLTVFQIITLDNWAIFMYNLIDADISFMAVIYLFLIVVFGSFFLLNLILAVIISAFIKIQQQDLYGEIQETMKKKDDELQESDKKEIEVERKIAEQSEIPLHTDEDFDNYDVDHNTDSPKKQVRQKLTDNTLNIQNWESPDKSNNFDIENSGINLIPMSDSSILANLDKEKETIDNSTKSNVGIASSKTLNLKSILQKAENITDQNILRMELSKLIQDTKQPDLSFLRKEGMKRKVIDIFLSKPKPQSQIGGESPSQEIKLFDTPAKLPQISTELLAPFESNKKSSPNDILNTEEVNEASSKIGQFLSIQKQKNSQHQYIQNVLEETKQQFGSKNSHSIRQLTTVKLGLKIRRQQNNITDQLQKFMLEHRAEKNKLYMITFKILKSKIFQLVISLSIVANTIILAMDRHPILPSQSKKLEQSNLGFSAIFMIEMIIKLIGLGIKGYFKDAFNTFDCIIVVTSVIDIALTMGKLKSSNTGITALRAFRLLRIFKLAKSWKRFQQLLKTIGHTLKDISTFSILLFLLMFTYTLLGMEMFAYQGKFNASGDVDNINGTYPDSNFNEFLEAITTVFIVLTNDGWADIYFNYYRGVNPLKATIFFITLIILGQKILLNLFLAVLLENFDADSLNQEIKKNFREKIAREQNKPKGRLQTMAQKVLDYFKSGFKKQQALTDLKYPANLSLKISSFGGMAAAQNTIKTSSYNNDTMKSSGSSPKLRRAFSQTIHNEAMLGRSLYIFSNQNKFREIIFNLVNWARFDNIILLAIGVSAVQLALENPLNDPNGKLVHILHYMDLSTTIVFSIEMVLKIIAFGFAINGPNSYLKNPWNLMDFIIVIFSIVSLSAFIDKLKLFKMFRLLRPLRVISKNEGLRIAVKSLAQAVPSMINIVIIMLLFFVCFGIIAISFFKGKYFSCDQSFISFTLSGYISNKWDCMSSGGEWINSNDNFDNIINAIMTLFLLATTSGWSQIMYISMSTTSIDYVQVDKNKPYWSIFFIVFIIVGAFFLLNLFVGVVISTFNRERENIGGNDLLTDKQREWLETRLLMLKSKPIKLFRPPENKFRRIMFKISTHNYFENMIFVSIILNTLILMLKWYQQPALLGNFTDGINFFFTAIFTFEAIFKLIGYGRSYFKDSWNIFDLIVVAATLLSVVITANTRVNLNGATTIIRSFRVLRVFRLIKRAKSLSLVFNTFLVTLPAMANIGGLLFLLIYLYSIIGMTLFADVQRNGVFNDTQNFESFTNSFLVMFKVATGDGWNDVMNAVTIDRGITSSCIASPTYTNYVENNYTPIGCPANNSAYLFFYSYILLVNLIFLNLFIAIILQGFDDVQSRENRQLNPDLLEKFKNAWSKFDPDATTFIQIYQLKDLLIELGEPLGWNKSYQNTKFLQDKFIKQLELPVYNNTIPSYQFMDVIKQLSFKLLIKEQVTKKKLHNEDNEYLEESDLSEEERKNTDQMEEQIKNEWEKDINQLQFQTTHLNIHAVKNVNKNEEKTQGLKQTLKRDSYYTSIHYAAAEVVLNHLRYLVAKRKLAERIKNLSSHGINEQDEGPDTQNQILNSTKSNASGKKFTFDSENDLIHKNSLQNKRNTQVKQKLTSNALQKYPTRPLSVISESRESYHKSKSKSKTSRISNNEVDRLIQQEMGRKSQYMESTIQTDINLDMDQDEYQQKTQALTKLPSDNLNNIIKSIFNEEQFSDVDLGLMPPQSSRKQKARPPKLAMQQRFLSPQKQQYQQIIIFDYFRARTGTIGAIGDSHEAGHDIDLDALQKEVEDLLKSENSPMMKHMGLNQPNGGNVSSLIKKELSRMISRAATKKFIEKMVQNDDQSEDQEMKRYIMHDSFNTDNSYEQSNESQDIDYCEEEMKTQ